MANRVLPADLAIDVEAFFGAIVAFTNGDSALAGALLGSVLADHAPVPPTLGRPLPPHCPPLPPDIHGFPGPWHEVRDPAHPCVGDAAVLACRVLHRLHVFDELVTWVETVRQRDLVWPEEVRPEIDLAAVDVREGRLREGRSGLETLLSRQPDLPPARRATVQFNLALTLSQLGEFQRARELMVACIASSRLAHVQWDLSHHLLGHGLLEVRNFRLDEGEELIRQSLAMSRSQGQHIIAYQAMSNLAICLYKQGRPDEALALIDECEGPLLESRNLQGWVQARLVRCKCHLVAGRYAEAVVIAEVMEREAAARSYRRERGLAVEMLGDAAVLAGDHAAARRRYQCARDMAHGAAPGGDLVAGLTRRLAEVTLLEGDAPAAVLALQDAEVRSREAGEPFEVVVSGRMLAEALYAVGTFGEARSAARRAVAAGRLHGCNMELSRALLAEARAEAELATGGGGGDGDVDGQRETAWSLAAEARAITMRLGFARDREACDRFLSRLREAWRAAWVWSGGPPPPESLATDASPEFIAGSPAMVAAAEQMAVAAASHDAVLVTGETGTGKEIVARRIHGMSGRSRGPLVSVNCAAVPVDLFEREFFGHAPGAFTGADRGARGLVEHAHRGTLFLDEVGDLPAAVQAKLLRLIQEGTYRRLGDPAERWVDLRVIAATNVDLPSRVAAGGFRADLYFRLGVLEVWLPPLRERGADVLALARAFVRRGLGDGGDLAAVFPPEMLAVLECYDWPGNIRELEALTRRACLYRRSGRQMPVGLLPVGLREVVCGGRGRSADREGDRGDGVGVGRYTEYSVRESPAALRLDDVLAATERQAILEALRAAHGNRSRAAERLGISRKTLYAKIRRLDIELVAAAD